MKLVTYVLMASSYRENIYCKMSSILKSDFIIGPKVGDIKEMDISHLETKVFQPKRIKLFRNVCVDLGVISFIRKNHYDTLITGGDAYNITVWLLLFYCKIKGIKVIMWSHGFYGRETKRRINTKRFFFGFADRLWVYGEYAKKLLSENKVFPKEKTDVVFNSLDYEVQLNLRNNITPSMIFNEHFKNCNPVIVFVGRLIFDKELDKIIKAANKLKNEGLPINIVLIGDGPARNSLETIADKTTTWFYGKCFDQKVLSELIYNADLCVTPGAIGLTAMHSMMFGCPVITNDDFTHQGPEFESITEGVTGSFYKHNNTETLADTIKQWFLSNHDREEVRQSCFKVIDEKYNPNVQIRIMSESLTKLNL